MADNLNDNEKNEDSDNNQNVIEISKLIHKKLDSNEKSLSIEEINKNKLIEDINQTMKLLDISYEDNGIEVLDNTWYFKNDPKYHEINEYIVGEELGEGMFSFVKEFVHKYSLKRYAAKVMNRERIAKKGQSFVDNITIEINLVRKLNHKNVIHIYDFFSINKNYYLILEYCYAVLEEYLIKRTKNLPKSQSHFYFCQIIEGLDYLHSIGIIHRDIKPTNILITPSNQVKLTDFGVCHILDKFSDSDILWILEGTPFYQPPEVHKDPFTGYSGTKFDIWSSGITLFRMVTGRIPFDDSDLNFYDNILTNDIDFPEEILEDKQLLHLLQEIFIKDFNKRITIEKIKKHPWFLLKHSQKHFRSLPPKLSGDLYRSLSIMPYVQNHYYSSGSSDEEQLVTKEEYEESSDRTLNIRSNRLSSKRKVRKNRKTSPFRRLVKLGLNCNYNRKHS